jgi:hypothetical protein
MGMECIEMEHTETCCYLDLNEKPCSKEAVYWIGKTDYDATFACEDHKDALTFDDATVVKLEKK